MIAVRGVAWRFGMGNRSLVTEPQGCRWELNYYPCAMSFPCCGTDFAMG